MPTRVINAVNLNNPKEVLSVGLTWVSGEAEKNEILKVATSNSAENQERADGIKGVATKVSAELYESKSDDNLGMPF